MYPKGSIVDNFLIVDGPFDGSFGHVYKAVNQKTNETVALKVAKSPTDVVQQQRFQLENEILHKLHPHENVVAPKSNVIVENGDILYAMDFLKNDLRTVLSTLSQTDYSERIEIFKHVCKGLKHAHENDVFHRDLHEGNIRFTENENVAQITDFGLGKDLQSTIISSKPFVIGGDYVKPPELVFQITDAPDQNQFMRADIYALGVTLLSLFVSSQMHFIANLFSIQSYLNGLNPMNPASFYTLSTPEKNQHYENWLTVYDRNIQNFLTVQIADINLGLRLTDIIKKMCNPDFRLRYARIDDVLTDIEGVI